MDMSACFKSGMLPLVAHGGRSLQPPVFLSAAVAVNIVNGIKQDNSVDLQLGQQIMIGTNPRWQMTTLLALWIDGFKARVHYRECVAPFVDRCGKKKKKNQFSLSFYFSLTPFLLVVNLPPLAGFFQPETADFSL